MFQLAAGRRQPAHDGSHRDIQKARSFRVFKSFDIYQNDRLALRLGEFHDPGKYLFCENTRFGVHVRLDSLGVGKCRNGLRFAVRSSTKLIQPD
jgi:hypothetical protein